MTTAAATTAPQVGATPTSSTPATRACPSFHSRRSWRRVGTIAVIDRQGSRLRPGAGRVVRAPAAARTTARRQGSAAGAPLPERGGLADPVAQEVELSATDLAVAEDLDLVDPGA